MIIVILTLLVFFLIQYFSNKILAKHPYYGKVTMSVTCPKFLLFVTIGAFAICCGWINLIDWFDGMRNISFWIPIVGDDPLFGELLEGAAEYGVEIPESERGADLQLAIDTVRSIYNTAFFCLLLALGLYAFYIKGVFRQNKNILWGCLLVLVFVTIAAIRQATAGIIHIVNWATSSVFNPYTGDLSDSIVLPFVTFIVTSFLLICVLIQKDSINKLIAYSSAEHPKQQLKQETPQTKIPQSTNVPNSDKPKKRCPYCGEEILAVAKKCRHCGEWLDKDNSTKQIVCPICGEMIDDGLETCPICHEKIKENKQNLRADTSISHYLIANKKILIMISLVILMATIIFILIENKDSNVGSPMHYDNQEEWYMDTVPAPTDTVSVDDYYEY
jgi:predicted RNA-binding Zn-ribbon protein involved in translation (DUF1610 family)